MSLANSPGRNKNCERERMRLSTMLVFLVGNLAHLAKAVSGCGERVLELQDLDL